MSESEYKLERLTTFLGEKKLKQLGLLTCETCNRILAHTEGVLSEASLSKKIFLTPDELAEINDKFYEAAGIQKPFTKSTAEPTTEFTTELSTELVTEPDTELPTEFATKPDTKSVVSSHKENIAPFALEALEETFSRAPKTNTSIPVSTYSLWDTKKIDRLIAEILLDITTSRSYTSPSLGMGYLYNIYPPLPPHSLACTECGRLYAIAHPSLQLMPLPVSLTHSEYEMLKGVYVDIFL